MFKALVFLGYYLFGLPAGAQWARDENGTRRDILFGALLFSVILTKFVINLFPDPEWRGTARGFGFYITDFLAPMVLFSMIGWHGWKVRLFPPGSGYYWLYLLLCLPSLSNARYAVPWGYEIWKMFMMYLFYITIYNYIWNRQELFEIIWVIVASLLVMLAVSLYQKYVQHLYHIAVTFPHRNSMALFTVMYGSILFGILMNENLNKRQWLLTAMGVGAAGLLVIFSYSRGGMVAFVLAMAITTACTLFINGFTLRRIQVLGVMFLLTLIPFFIALPRIVQRFVYAPESSAQTRVNLARAAVRMANDRFFGVGLNNFSDRSGPQFEYNREHYAAYKDQEAIMDRRGGIVETIYLLTAAECGWIGLAALLLWLLWIWLQNVFNLFAYRKREGFGFAAGIAGGLSANMAQSALEWSWKQSGNFYQLMFVFALVGIMTYYRRERQRKSRSRGRLQRT